MPTEGDIQQLQEEMEEIKKWVRIQGLDSLSKILKDFDDSKKLIFEEADGKSTTKEIGERAGVSSSTVSNRMKEWHQLGIVEKEGRQWKHIAPLSAMGIQKPDLDEIEE